MLDTILRLVALLAVIGLTSTAHAAVGYNFTRLVDHVDDNFDSRSFNCASINESGDVAFNADFRGAKSAHILHRNPQRFSRILLLFVSEFSFLTSWIVTL